jgi:hypothetical protein
MNIERQGLSRNATLPFFLTKKQKHTTMKIGLEHYIVTNNPSGVEAMLRKRNIPASKSLPDAVQKIRFILSKEGASAAKELADIDTDYKHLILSSEDKTSNACGCSGADGDDEESSNCAGNPNCSCGKTSSADAVKVAEKVTAPVVAPPVTSDSKYDLHKHAPVIALGLLLIAVTAILVKK